MPAGAPRTCSVGHLFLMLKRQCHEEEKVVNEGCSAMYELCGLGPGSPTLWAFQFQSIKAGDNNGTDPSQFEGGVSESVFVQMMGKASFHGDGHW